MNWAFVLVPCVKSPPSLWSASLLMTITSQMRTAYRAHIDIKGANPFARPSRSDHECSIYYMVKEFLSMPASRTISCCFNCISCFCPKSALNGCQPPSPCPLTLCSCPCILFCIARRYKLPIWFYLLACRPSTVRCALAWHVGDPCSNPASTTAAKNGYKDIACNVSDVII